MCPARRVILIALGVAMTAVPCSSGLSGTVSLEDGTPVAGAFTGLMRADFSMAGHAVTDASGRFSIGASAEDGYVAVQPPAAKQVEGIGVYAAQPRLYKLNGEEEVALELPASACLVLRGYDNEGRLLRWEDYEREGVFRQFAMPTDLDGVLQPFACWPVFDETARQAGSPREKGLPALVCPVPTAPLEARVLFWKSGAGLLHLRADNAGQGYALREGGDAVIIELNAELARTAVHDLQRRQASFLHQQGDPTARIGEVAAELGAALSLTGAKERAAACDAVLAKAVLLRDELEVESARCAIPWARKGMLEVRVLDASGTPVQGAEVTISQRSRSFLFGVFEGSPYNAGAFRTARKAGFELATVLLGWNWTDAHGGPADLPGIEQTFGISRLRDLGYTVKAHGVVWLQQFGIMPARAGQMAHDALCEAMLDQEQALIGAFGSKIALWEAMNEPAATNQVGMPRATVNNLLGRSAELIASYEGLTSLVNSPHEVDYGHKYLFHTLGNRPENGFPITYLDALRKAETAGALEEVDVVGLQFYPGFHHRAELGGMQGPAVPPSWLVDTVESYSEFGKPLHITEFSIPSSYGSGWISGYWREPWNPEVQADYAEAVFTLMFGNPRVQSVSWWDVTDQKPSILTGGLVDVAGSPKPALERIEQLLKEWVTEETGTTQSDGTVRFAGFGGDYEVRAVLPGGAAVKGSAVVRERDVVHVTLKRE